MAKIIEGLKYTKSHEWVKEQKDHFIIGITDFAQSELGDVVFVELPNIGRYLQKSDPFGTVESVKTVSEVYSPVSGEIIEVNSSLNAQPELINSAPYESGWIIKIKPQSMDLSDLLDSENYKELIQN